MATPAPAFAAVAAVLTDIDPADDRAVEQFYGSGLTRYPPRAQALIADFLIGLTDMPYAGELQAMKSTLARPAEEMPELDVPRRRTAGRQGSKAAPAPSVVDAHIGARVRQRRLTLGLSEAQLGAAAGLTVRQIQRCEQGVEGLMAAALYDLSRALRVPATYFFQNVPATDHGEAMPRRAGFADTQAEFEPDPEAPESEQIALLRVYETIRDPAARRRAIALISGLAS